MTELRFGAAFGLGVGVTASCHPNSLSRVEVGVSTGLEVMAEVTRDSCSAQYPSPFSHTESWVLFASGNVVSKLKVGFVGE